MFLTPGIYTTRAIKSNDNNNNFHISVGCNYKGPGNRATSVINSIQMIYSCLPLTSLSHPQPCPWTARWSRLGQAGSNASLTCIQVNNYTVLFSAALDTLQVISEKIFTANHSLQSLGFNARLQDSVFTVVNILVCDPIAQTVYKICVTKVFHFFAAGGLTPGPKFTKRGEDLSDS